jgi:hypothetical protein
MKKTFLNISLAAALLLGACEDFVTQEPVNVITPEDVIIDAESAEAAILGVYSRLQTADLYGTRLITDPGVLSDELTHSGSFPSLAEFDQNNVSSRNATADDVWIQAYTTLYQANNIIERLAEGNTYTGLTAADQKRILNEARFVRALTLFNLTNLYGDTPLALNTVLSELSSLSRTPQAEVYSFVIEEAASVASELNAEDIEFPSDEEQFRGTRWAAKALQARALLYAGRTAEAGAVANEIITSGVFELADKYSDLFGGGPVVNDEIIFSIWFGANDQNGLEFQFLPAGRFEFAVSPQMLEAFGSGDARALVAVNGADGAGRSYVNKYSDLATGTDGVIVFRLAEMYLIRAEANLATNPTAALADLNMLRTRAGLTELTGITMDDIMRERFVELSFEGHRWYDLRRTGRLVSVMEVVSAGFTENDQFLPVPAREIEQNPNLTQNPGY